MLFGKNYDNAFKLSTNMRLNTAVCFSEAVRDNVVFDDVTMTSSFRIDVITLRMNFILS